MQFGKARAKLAQDDKRKVTFNDVAGADEEKAELQEIVEFLKNPQKFVQIGARIPKGVLLVGCLLYTSWAIRTAIWTPSALLPVWSVPRASRADRCTLLWTVDVYKRQVQRGRQTHHGYRQGERQKGFV